MVELIIKKRDGKELSKSEIDQMVKGFTTGKIPDYQISAFLMATYLNGLTNNETALLTEAMIHSGQVVDLSDIPGVKVDKHSTGGVGDKTTLVLAPLVAAAGVPVAKMTGRGLGHTGGTIDKLESIKGFSIEMTVPQFIKNVKDYGIALCGQTEDMVPADKKLYALRDITGTVNNVSLIASSIMSKKLACGADAIVIDIKIGEGAYMANQQEAEDLAKIMISIGNKMKRKVNVIISSMEEPLGNAIGNALEVKEAIDTLKGNGPKDLEELCLSLGSRMLILAEKAQSEKEARIILKEILKSGKALEKFRTFISVQGGNPAFINDTDLLPTAACSKELLSDKSGYITKVLAKEIGLASMKLGAGRETKESTIHHEAGIVLAKKTGDFVHKGDLLATMYCNQNDNFQMAYKLLQRAYNIESEKALAIPLIVKIIK